jgi:hypothetical protein
MVGMMFLASVVRQEEGWMTWAVLRMFGEDGDNAVTDAIVTTPFGYFILQLKTWLPLGSMVPPQMHVGRFEDG